MNVILSEIPIEGLHLSFQLLPENDEVVSRGLVLSQAFEVEADLIRLGEDEVYLSGSFCSEIIVDCVRCLNKMKLALKSEFKLTYVPSFVNQSEEEVLSRESLDLNYYDGEEISLDQELVGQLLLAIPMRPLCDTSCKGLCMQCGIDLNRLSCQCQREPSDLRWAKLLNFRYKESDAKSKT